MFIGINMDEESKEVRATVPNIDTELSIANNRLTSIICDLNVGVYGSFDTAVKEEDKPKLEASLRTITDRVIDIQRQLSTIESLVNNIRNSPKNVGQYEGMRIKLHQGSDFAIKNRWSVSVLDLPLQKAVQIETILNLVMKV